MSIFEYLFLFVVFYDIMSKKKEKDLLIYICLIVFSALLLFWMWNSRSSYNDLYASTFGSDLPDFIGELAYQNTLASPRSSANKTSSWIVFSNSEIQNILLNSDSFSDFYQRTRISIIEKLIDKKFDRFVQMPYAPWTWNINLSGDFVYPDYPDFIVHKWIYDEDFLDWHLRKFFRQYKNELANFFVYWDIPENVDFSFTISESTISEWNNIFLFKSTQDLYDLGYVVSSYRLRENNDPQYRRTNIFVSLHNMWNIRILNPWEVFSFNNYTNYNKDSWDHTIQFWLWYGNIWGIRSVRWWWKCGASTSVFQTIMTNEWIEVIEDRNHTRHYYNLYNVDINWKNARIPGLDIAVYRLPAWSLDLKFKNIRDYPIIFVSMYDGSLWWIEEAFTLSRISDRWDYHFKYRNGNCFTWEINWEDLRRCYSALIWYH